MGKRRNEMSDAEFGELLVNLYDNAAAACGDDHKDEAHPMASVKAWSKAGASASDDEGDTPLGGGGPGAADAAMRRSWSKASAPVRMALDSCELDVGRSASDSLAVAEANLRLSGWDSELMTELRAYHAQATKPRGAARSTQALKGYNRLK